PQPPPEPRLLGHPVRAADAMFQQQDLRRRRHGFPRRHAARRHAQAVADGTAEDREHVAVLDDAREAPSAGLGIEDTLEASAVFPGHHGLSTGLLRIFLKTLALHESARVLR